MGVVSIDLERMTHLVSAMETATGGVPDLEFTIRGSLSRVRLSTEALSTVDEVALWLEDELPSVRRRLALAQQIEASTLGVQLYVQFDESDISMATPEEARERAQRAAELIDGYAGDIPDELVNILDENANDPYFAHELALQVSPDEAAQLVLDISAAREALPMMSDRDMELIEELDGQYERLLDGLGTSFGLATRSGGDLELPDDYAQVWADAIISPLDPASDSSVRWGQPGALGLIISHGHWSTDFLTTVTEQIYMEERVRDQPGMWQDQALTDATGDFYGAVAPGGGRYFDPLAGVLEAVGRDPEAGHYLFGAGELTNLPIDGETTQVNALLKYLVFDRQWPVDDGAGAQAAIAMAMTPYLGGDTISADIAADARAIVEAKAAEIEANREETNWFSEIGHLVLDALGLVPGFGEPADAVNAVWYAAEGDAVNAALSAAAMVPFAGWAATGGRWARRGVDAMQLARNATRLDGTPLDPSVAGSLLARADNVSPGVFEFSSRRAFNRAANNPHPGITYRYRGVDWTTDELGRTASVSGTIRLEPGGRNSRLTGQIGNAGRDSDVGFHLLADSLGGPTNRLNVVPGNGRPIDDGLANLNQGEYARMERQLRNALGEGRNVEVEIVPSYRPGNTSTRPDTIDVFARIDGRMIEFNFTNR